jgi:hypothetical protein
MFRSYPAALCITTKTNERLYTSLILGKETRQLGIIRKTFLPKYRISYCVVVIRIDVLAYQISFLLLANLFIHAVLDEALYKGVRRFCVIKNQIPRAHNLKDILHQQD